MLQEIWLLRVNLRQRGGVTYLLAVPLHNMRTNLNSVRWWWWIEPNRHAWQLLQISPTNHQHCVHQSSLPPTEPNITCPSPFLVDLSHLYRIYILQLAQTANVGQLQNNKTRLNKLMWVTMVLERWNFARSMAQRIVDTLVLVWWRYSKNSWCRVIYLDRMASFDGVYHPISGWSALIRVNDT